MERLKDEELANISGGSVAAKVIKGTCAFGGGTLGLILLEISKLDRIPNKLSVTHYNMAQHVNTPVLHFCLDSLKKLWINAGTGLRFSSWALGAYEGWKLGEKLCQKWGIQD